MLHYKIEFGKLQTVEPMKGVQYKVYKHNNKQIRSVEYSKEMPLHWCNKGHYGYILEGEFEIEYSNEKIVYKPGDGVFIPGGDIHKHQAKALTDIVKVIFVEDL